MKNYKASKEDRIQRLKDELREHIRLVCFTMPPMSSPIFVTKGTCLIMKFCRRSGWEWARLQAKIDFKFWLLLFVPQKSLHQIANVAFMETNLPANEQNPLEQSGELVWEKRTFKKKSSSGKKDQGTLWDQEK